MIGEVEVTSGKNKANLGIFHPYPNLANDPMAHLLLSKSFTFHFLSHANNYISASCGNKQSHITRCLSLYPRKVHSSKYVRIWWLRRPLRDSYFLHKPFLICSSTLRANFIILIENASVMKKTYTSFVLSEVNPTELDLRSLQ